MKLWCGFCGAWRKLTKDQYAPKDRHGIRHWSPHDNRGHYCEALPW